MNVLVILLSIIILVGNYIYYKNKRKKELLSLEEIKEKNKEEIEKLLIEQQKQLEKSKISLLESNRKNLKNHKSLLNKKYNVLKNNLELEYNKACETAQNEIIEKLKNVDGAIAEFKRKTLLKNTLMFSCVCSKDLIPCPIDFTKENTFVCPKCGSKYKVALSAEPILIDRAVNEKQLADLIEERLNENKE